MNQSEHIKQIKQTMLEDIFEDLEQEIENNLKQFYRDNEHAAKGDRENREAQESKLVEKTTDSFEKIFHSHGIDSSFKELLKAYKIEKADNIIKVFNEIDHLLTADSLYKTPDIESLESIAFEIKKFYKHAKEYHVKIIKIANEILGNTEIYKEPNYYLKHSKAIIAAGATTLICGTNIANLAIENIISGCIGGITPLFNAVLAEGQFSGSIIEGIALIEASACSLVAAIIGTGKLSHEVFHSPREMQGKILEKAADLKAIGDGLIKHAKETKKI